MYSKLKYIQGFIDEISSEDPCGWFQNKGVMDLSEQKCMGRERANGFQERERANGFEVGHKLNAPMIEPLMW